MSGLIPEDIINRIRDSVDIVELVSRYLALKKAGSTYKALCPFHKEKTPSFIVTPARQSFHCFGCGKGGNAFHFVMAMERISFPESVRSLAKETGIDIPEERAVNDEVVQSERTVLYEVNSRAADYFARMLASPAGKAARAYVAGRGISDDMVERCKLGFSPDSWDAFINAARAAKFPANALVRAGLAIEREDGGCYDRFRNRLMFPIFDTQERVVGFGARTMADDDVKYINTPETPIFSKGKNLYGLNWARKSIVDNKRVAVVEGYTDVIMAHQHGIENVVATLGTALTRENVYTLRRFAGRIDVVFDSDPAGQQAAERSMELFLSEGAGDLIAAGFDVRIATVEGGKDPCEVINEKGPAPFTTALENAVDIFSKKIEIVLKRYDCKTIEGKIAAADDVLGLVMTVPNAVGRQLRIDSAVRALSNMLDLDDATLRIRLAQIEKKRRATTSPEREAVPPLILDPIEKGLITGLISDPQCASEICAEIAAEDFQNKTLRNIFQKVKEQFDEDGVVNHSRLLDNLAEPDSASVVSEILSGDTRQHLGAIALDCMRTLIKKRSQHRIQQIKKKLELARSSGNQAEADRLNDEFLKLQREVLPL